MYKLTNIIWKKRIMSFDFRKLNINLEKLREWLKQYWRVRRDEILKNEWLNAKRK